jgi:hypothetical protein
MFLFIELPVLMVLSGGVVGSFMLILVVYAAYYFKYKRTQIIKSGLIYDTAFWISVMTIFAVGVYGILKVSF